MDHEKRHGRDITLTLRGKESLEHIIQAWSGTSWIVKVIATGTRDGKPFQATYLFLTSLRTTQEALLQLVRDRWSIEGWHWIRDTPGLIQSISKRLALAAAAPSSSAG